MAKAKINPEFTYKTRDGREVTNLQINLNNTVYPIAANVDGYYTTYTECGYFYADGSLCGYDLIKQPVKKPKPVVKENQKEVMKNASTLEVKRQDNITTHHKHHDLIVAWAKNPKVKTQFKSKYDNNWYNNDSKDPHWGEDQEYRFKPEEPNLLTIIGVDGKARSYPEPCMAKPEVDSVYYIPTVRLHELLSDRYYWNNDTKDNRVFLLGIVHLTNEAAELHAKAMLGID